MLGVVLVIQRLDGLQRNKGHGRPIDEKRTRHDFLKGKDAGPKALRGVGAAPYRCHVHEVEAFLGSVKLLGHVAKVRRRGRETVRSVPIRDVLWKLKLLKVDDREAHEQRSLEHERDAVRNVRHACEVMTAERVEHRAIHVKTVALHERDHIGCRAVMQFPPLIVLNKFTFGQYRKGRHRTRCLLHRENKEVMKNGGAHQHIFVVDNSWTNVRRRHFKIVFI